MPECCYCIHVRQNLATGEQTCACEQAHEELGEETVRRQLAGGEHDCRFFEDDELPW